MGGGLNHFSLLLEFTQIYQNNRNTLSLAHGVWTTDVKSTAKTLPYLEEVVARPGPQ